MKLDVIDTSLERTYVVWESAFAKVKKFEDNVNEFVREDYRDMIIDLANITKIDSMSLSAIIRLKNRLNDSGRSLRLINLNEDIHTVIELAGLESLL